MLKETGYQEKFVMLKEWLVDIIDVVKGDLKNEHLKIDRAFCKRYFLGKNFVQLTATEMAPAYERDIAEGNVGLGEFIASRWLLKNTDIYGLFEERLKPYTEDFDELEELTAEQSLPLMKQALAQFGATRTYLFAVLNSVVFPKEVYEELEKRAKKETLTVREKRELIEEERTLKNLEKRHERELNAISDRFEKKLVGMQRKYLKDVASLKKQVSTLQRKLTEVKK